MIRTDRFLAALLLASVWGCQSEPPTTAPKNAEEQASTSGSTAKSEPAAPTLDAIPAELKHDGYSYYGLANAKPMAMEAVYSSVGTVMTGAQTITLKEVKDGKAVFNIERTGQLADLGTQEVTLEKDGIYVTASSVAKVNHDLEIPASLPAGTKWDNKMVVDQPGREVEMNSTFKIVGEQKVKTKVGDRTGILITSTGTGKMRGESVKMESQNWYVRDIGGVKSVIKIIHSNGKSETVTIQETK